MAAPSFVTCIPTHIPAAAPCTPHTPPPERVEECSGGTGRGQSEGQLGQVPKCPPRVRITGGTLPSSSPATDPAGAAVVRSAYVGESPSSRIAASLAADRTPLGLARLSGWRRRRRRLRIDHHDAPLGADPPPHTHTLPSLRLGPRTESPPRPAVRARAPAQRREGKAPWLAACRRRTASWTSLAST